MLRGLCDCPHPQYSHVLGCKEDARGSERLELGGGGRQGWPGCEEMEEGRKEKAQGGAVRRDKRRRAGRREVGWGATANGGGRFLAHEAHESALESNLVLLCVHKKPDTRR